MLASWRPKLRFVYRYLVRQRNIMGAEILRFGEVVQIQVLEHSRKAGILEGLPDAQFVINGALEGFGNPLILRGSVAPLVEALWREIFDVDPGIF